MRRFGPGAPSVRIQLSTFVGKLDTTGLRACSSGCKGGPEVLAAGAQLNASYTRPVVIASKESLILDLPFELLLYTAGGLLRTLGGSSSGDMVVNY